MSVPTCIFYATSSSDRTFPATFNHACPASVIWPCVAVITFFRAFFHSVSTNSNNYIIRRACIRVWRGVSSDTCESFFFFASWGASVSWFCVSVIAFFRAFFFSVAAKISNNNIRRTCIRVSSGTSKSFFYFASRGASVFWVIVSVIA